MLLISYYLLRIFLYTGLVFLPTVAEVNPVIDIGFLLGVKRAITQDVVKLQKILKPDVADTSNPFFQLSTLKAQDLYRERALKQYIGDHPILVIFTFLGTNQFGNLFGALFDLLACADKIGLHAVVIGDHLDNDNRDESEERDNYFHSQVTSVYLHENPVYDFAATSNALRELCWCTSFCWVWPNSPWIHFAAGLRKIFRTAFNISMFPERISSGVDNVIKYRSWFDADDVILSQNITIITKHNTTRPIINGTLPLIPDVAIQYRCGDNIMDVDMV